MKDHFDENLNNLMTDEILFFHQEKRTALAKIRIGIAAIVAQISILGFLMATSRHYELANVLHWLIPFVLLNLVVLVIAGYLIIGSIIQINQIDQEIIEYKRSRARLVD